MELTLALIQMSVTTDKEENLRRACEAVRKAGKVDIAVLPEMFCCPYDSACFRAYGEEQGGTVYQTLAALAREQGIYLVGGTMPELENGSVYNTCYVFDPEGKCIARHRKTHLFDIDVEGGQSFRESDTLSAGRDVTTFETPWGVMGVCVCFDFRFPELSRLMALRGAQVIFVPAAFNMTTGPAHWELLFRQRAVDEQCFTVGCAPARDMNASYHSWGHSIVCSPWGDVLHRCEETETTLIAKLDMSLVPSIRRQLPLLSARRTDLYETREV